VLPLNQGRRRAGNFSLVLNHVAFASANKILEVSVVAAQSESDNLAPAAVAATAAQSDEPSVAEFDSAHLATDSSS
jgi:hypothetical protein